MQEQTLIENAIINDGKNNVLDIGCGYGVVCLATKYDINVVMTDVNESF